jgi:hypothetical protein
MEFKTPRDKVIFKKMMNDKEQNEWFAKNEHHLYRIREDDVLASNYDALEDFIETIKKGNNSL